MTRQGFAFGISLRLTPSSAGSPWPRQVFVALVRMAHTLKWDVSGEDSLEFPIQGQV